MKSEQTQERLGWYVIHTKHKQEDRAENNLRAWGVETFNPKLKTRRTRAGSSSVVVGKPLFPQYIFARFDPTHMLHKITFTRGVHEVVRFGEQTIPLDNEMIAIMRMRVGDDGFIKIGEEFKAGDTVLVKDGPFRNFIGIFERELKESERVRILLTTVSFQSHIVLERDSIKKIAANV
ncbi:MAG TPA: transcription termination/antitermination NusG family protein [Pyrinomonadaceae bacterium]|nr:transcription termination/antitermination NusG family protein [Pyrinomonadaceae bacterium]